MGEPQTLLKLDLFDIRSYKIIKAPNFFMKIDDETNVAMLSKIIILPIISCIPFKDMTELQQKYFIYEMNDAIEKENPMFMLSIAEVKADDGSYRYWIRGIK